MAWEGAAEQRPGDPGAAHQRRDRRGLPRPGQRRPRPHAGAGGHARLPRPPRLHQRRLGELQPHPLHRRVGQRLQPHAGHALHHPRQLRLHRQLERPRHRGAEPLPLHPPPSRQRHRSAHHQGVRLRQHSPRHHLRRRHHPLAGRQRRPRGVRLPGPAGGHAGGGLRLVRRRGQRRLPVRRHGDGGAVAGAGGQRAGWARARPTPIRRTATCTSTRRWAASPQ